MLKFVSAYLALSYLAFAGLTVAGALQMLAAWRSLVGFALVDYRRHVWGYPLGPLMVAVAYAWFFGTRREILTPGPAGAELLILFGGGTIAALALTLAGASILRPYYPHGAEARLPVAGQAVDLGQRFTAHLYATHRIQRAPAVCLLPDPASPPGHLRPLMGQLLRQGFVVLVPVWRRDLQSYPAALPLVAWSLAYLRHQAFVDGERIALVGVNLGGDLAVRAALEERTVPPVVALAPDLDERNAPSGLGALREMTYGEALGWRLGGRRRQLLHGMESLQALVNLPPRRGLVVYGADDSIVPPAMTEALRQSPEIGASVRTVLGENHLSLVSSPRANAIVLGWLAESLHLGIHADGRVAQGREPATGEMP